MRGASLVGFGPRGGSGRVSMMPVTVTRYALSAARVRITVTGILWRRKGAARLSGSGEFGVAEQQRVAGGELAQDAGQQVGAGVGRDGGEDGSGVPAGGGQGGAGAGGEVLDEGPAAQRLSAGDLGGEDARGFDGEAGGQFDAFVAGQLASQCRKDEADGFPAFSRVGQAPS
ncbi:hypothetical protein FB157_13518 [Streptomyces sp. BK340]|nr:hypothetical protein FB157_13518 [Streptomyces sp. BK340]